MVTDAVNLFNALYNSDLCAILFSDMDGRITQVNEHGARILGYPQRELVGTVVASLAPEEDRTRLEEHIASLGERQSVKLTHRFIRKNGDIRWINGSLSRFVNPDGEEMMESIFIDVTPEKEAEERRDKTLEVMSSVASKYDAFYICDVTRDTFLRIDEKTGRTDDTHVSDAGAFSATVEEFAREGIDDEFKTVFSRFLSFDNIRSELAPGRDSFEFQYKESKILKSRWKLGEIIAVSRDETGDVTRFCLLITDINDLKFREFERMRTSQAQAALVDIAFDMSGLFDFTYIVPERTIVCSERTQRANGSEERYENMPEAYHAFIHPDYYDVFDAMYERCNEGEVVSSSEFKDIAGHHWYKTTLHLIESFDDGSPRLALGIVERKDEVHEAQSEAARMQQLCRYAIESHYEALVLIDAQRDWYSFVDVGNGVPLTWDEIPTSGPYDATVRDIIRAKGDDEAERQAIEELCLESLVPAITKSGRSSHRYLTTSTTGGARWKLVECTFFNKEVDKILMLISDVQDEEMAKEELREARQAADEANRAKSAFLANMSHEIRTPMNTIIGISEILMNKPLPVETINEISTIQNAASGLLAIINDILDFSKIESGKFVVNPVDYMLPSVLMDISNMISVRLVDKPVVFLINVDHSIPNHLIGDDIRVEQILMNLLGNSVKFTKEGFIELSVEGEAIDESSYKLIFKVRDSGIGIKKEDIGKLFGSFSQVDTTKNRAVTGSGLGLAISKSFAEMMGGGITIDSTYGKGTTFTVEIVQRVKDHEPIGEVRHKDARVLICETNEVIIDSVSRTLSNLGVEFQVCRELDKVRSYKGMTHMLIRRSRFVSVKEKVDFMFDPSNVYLVLDNGEQPSGDYIQYKQLQLQLLCLQIINALNGETIANSYKRKNFDRSQIIPLTFAHVLIVDDNTTNLQVARGLMAPYQMQIDVATSGFKAIELAKSVQYDIIFMDHMMPEMDGLETTHHIRNLPGEYYKTLPIVALTANAVSDAKDLFLSNGMNDFLAKPIEMTELHRILKQYVQSKAPEGYLEAHARQVSENGRQTHDGPRRPVQVPHAAQIAVTQAPAPQGDVLGQLLAQNNALLSQNMLLLQNLLGETASPAIAPPPPSEAMSEDASDRPESDPIPVPGVDMGNAIEALGGSDEIYEGVLATYVSDIEERMPALQRMFESKDAENFTISAHAIKSASRGVGAEALGELAFELEKAGGNGDWSYIETHFQPFMQELGSTRERLNDYLEDRFKPADPSPTGDVLDSFPTPTVDALKEDCDNLDFMAAEEHIDQLGSHAYPESLEATIKTMKRYCSEFEYKKLEELVRAL